MSLFNDIYVYVMMEFHRAHSYLVELLYHMMFYLCIMCLKLLALATEMQKAYEYFHNQIS